MRYPFHDSMPSVGERMLVAEGIHWIRMPLPIQLNHINLWLLDDEEGAYGVDSGMATDETRACWETLFAGGLQLAGMIATHFHPDHLGLLRWLCNRFGLTPHMSLGEFTSAHLLYNQLPGFDNPTYAAHFARHGLPDYITQTYLQQGSAYITGIDGIPASFRRLTDGSLLQIGGRTWQCIAGYGHSPEHMALYCGDAGVLISGDMLLPRISTNVSCGPAEAEGDPLLAFMASLERFLELPNDTLVLPSHGKPFVGIHGRVRALLAHHQERLGALLAACDHPKHAHALMNVLFERELDHYQTFFAMGETIAHLNYLMYQGLVVRKEINHVLHFVRSGVVT